MSDPAPDDKKPYIQPESIEAVQSENAELVDRILHDILVNGEEKILPDGSRVRVTPSAAMLKAAMERGKQLGMQSPLGAGRAADDLAETARRMESGTLRFPGGGRMPPVSTDDDAATAM